MPLISGEEAVNQNRESTIHTYEVICKSTPVASEVGAVGAATGLS
jgi:hypothetical protein